MYSTTLCYLEREGHYLMLHRIKKKQDVNQGKWIGFGGKFLEGESPEDCLLREVEEETGYRLNSWRYRGILTFLAEGWEGEHIHLFTSEDFSGSYRSCEEGEAAWVKKEELFHLTLWEGDRIFLKLLLKEEPFFSLKLRYEGEELKEAVLNGRPLELSEALSEEALELHIGKDI